jgi:hypothetical protein
MSDKNKEVTIHKRNEIIRGGNIYSLSAQKLGNAIYHHVQYNRVFEDKRFQIPISSVREIMGLSKSNNYSIVIQKSLKELASPIELYNLDQITGMAKKGQSTLWQIAQFLIEPKIVKIGKEQYIDAQMSPTMRVLLANSSDGNFTQLVLNTYLNKVKSKHSYTLYEYIKSFENFNMIGNRIELSKERLDKMFNGKHSKKYLYFSSFKPLLERAVKDLNEHTDMCIELSADNKLKKYYIHRIKNKENSKKKTNVKNYEEHPLGKLDFESLKNK